MGKHSAQTNAPRHRRFNDLQASQQAGMLANDEQFRSFAGARIIQDGLQLEPSAAAEFIRRFCGVTSRRDLNTNPTAVREFQILRTEFDAWAGRISTPR